MPEIQFYIKRQWCWILAVMLACGLSFTGTLTARDYDVQDSAAVSLLAQATGPAQSAAQKSPPRSEAEQAELEYKERVKTVKEAMRQHFKELLKAEGVVSLYGRAVDQNGDPIPDAIIHLELRYYPPDYAQRVDRVMDGLEPEKSLNSVSDELTVTTDTEGKFSYTGKKGKSLQVVHIEQPAYSYWTPVGLTFDYGSGLGGRKGINLTNYWQPSSDFVISGWKNGEVERVIRRIWKIYFQTDSRPQWRINMLQETLSDESAFADLIITRSGEITSRSPNAVYEYTLTVLNGGVQLTQEPLAFKAPLEGYVESIKIRTTRGDSMNVDNVKKFYLKLRNGKVYAMMEVSFRVNGLLIKGTSNAQGGQLLLPESGTFINDGTIRRKPDMTIQEAEDIRAVDLRTQTAR